MKKIMKFVSLLLVLGSIAVASSISGGNPEVSVLNVNPTTVLGHCDPLEHFLGLCESSENILTGL